MKKLLFLLCISGLFMTLAAQGQSGPWIKTADGQINCKKITVSADNVKVVTADGEKRTLPTSSVLSYSQDNLLLIKLPLYIREVKGEVFMEFVRSKDDLSLYKYSINGMERYFIYRGENLYVALNDGNKAEFEKFFFVQL